MVYILDRIKELLPENADINSYAFEGANIVIYTKNKDFFLNTNNIIKHIVDTIKKRVELRMDPGNTIEMDKAKELVEKIVPGEAKITNIIFDGQRSRLIVEAEKPGIAIGKSGEVLKEIRNKTLWSPLVRRTPAIKSKIIENIRNVLYENNDYRKKFLNDVGKKIYSSPSKERKENWVRISFLGGARQVGRSCLFLQTPESKVLLDCGINVAVQGEEAFPILDIPEFSINELDAVIISHSHLDHVGFVPYLYKMGFRGPTYLTAPCRDISALLALDFISVAYKEAKKGIYDATDIKEMVKHSIALDYEEVNDIAPDMRLTFYNAGHVLGSAMVHLNIGNGMHNLLYTGDMKYIKTRVLEQASSKFPRLETLIIESTYGSKDDILPSRQVSEEELLGKIKEAVQNNGKVLIPVLGVGRAQEIMLVVEDAIKNGLIPRIPVFLDGMLWDITAIHTAYPTFLNSRIKKSIFHMDDNPLLSDIFKRVGSQTERKAVVEETGPCIILATSGMLQGGASVTYFKELADNPRNMLLFVSYQGRGSLGEKIQQGDPEIVLQDNGKPETIKIKMQRHTIKGFSAHAGRNELMRFVYNLDPKPKKIIIVHGESSKCLDLASSLHKAAKVETVAPKNLEVIRLR